MKRLLAIAVAVTAFAQVGCATIFTGTSDKVLIDCDPEGSTCVVLGGRGIGGLLVTATQINVASRKVIGMIEPHVGAEARGVLEKIDLNELIAALVMMGKLDQVPPEMVTGFRAILKKIPIGTIDDILDALGVQDFGVTPHSVKLHKGGSFGALCFKDGYKARIELVGLRFNWVTLLNIFNFGLGLLIDIPTGAWLNLEERVRIHLAKR